MAAVYRLAQLDASVHTEKASRKACRQQKLKIHGPGLIADGYWTFMVRCPPETTFRAPIRPASNELNQRIIGQLVRGGCGAVREPGADDPDSGAQRASELQA